MKNIFLLLILTLVFQPSYGQIKFNHILITNDDGIEDADRLLSLAKSVKNVSNRVSIIVSEFDRSGTSNHSIYGKYQSTFEVTCKYKDTENNITAYTLPTNPADCVWLGLSGFFGDDKPDLVLSGINSGSNMGPGWFESGTIGAVRTSAFLGVKAIAFSGFDDDNKKSFILIPNWIKDFISSGFIDSVDKNSYLTVGFPKIPFDEIKGIKLAKRRISIDKPEVIMVKEIFGEDPHIPENKTIWTLEYTENPNMIDMKYDDIFLHQGYIVITPMTVNENNDALMQNLELKTNLIPDFIKKKAK